MMADGYLVGDGSWNLKVYVTDLQVDRTLRVKGDLHIGGVMLKLVEDLGNYQFHVVLLSAPAPASASYIRHQALNQPLYCCYCYCTSNPID